jgi:hypothetical protein
MECGQSGAGKNHLLVNFILDGEHIFEVTREQTIGLEVHHLFVDVSCFLPLVGVQVKFSQQCQGSAFRSLSPQILRHWQQPQVPAQEKR